MSERRTRTIGVPGILLSVSGAVLVLLSLTTLTWYGGRSHGADSVGAITFSTLHRLTQVVPGESTSARWYFSWLAWTLLLIGIALGFAANLPTPAATVLRIAGLLTGLAGVAITYYALHQLFGSTGSHVFDNADAGVYVAMAGYLIIGLGAAAGPLPVRADAPAGA